MNVEFVKKTSAKMGIWLGVFLILFVALAPVVSPYDADAQEPARKLLAPNRTNWLGTDQFGRDVLTRIAVGGRRSLGAALLVVGGTLALSLFIGIAAVFSGKIVDAIVARLVDVFLAVPPLVLALAVVGVLGVGFENLLLALVVSSVAFYIRLVRSHALAARYRPDITAARLAGIGWTRVITTHVAPDVFRQMLLVATLDLGGIIVSVAGLSFLGLGAQPPRAEWGTMLGEARFYFTVAPYLLVAPAAAILIAIIAANLIGNALRDAEDAK